MKKLLNIFRIKSLKLQLLLGCISILMFSLVIMEISQYLAMKQNLYNSKMQLVESRFHNINLDVLTKIQSPMDVREQSVYIIRSVVGLGVDVAIIDQEGKVIAEGTKVRDSIVVAEVTKFADSLPVPKLSKNEYKEILNKKGIKEEYRFIKDKNGSVNMVGWRKIGNPNSSSGLIQLSTTIEPEVAILKRQLYTYIIASILILSIGIILVGLVLKYTLKPLYNMTNTVENITVGQLNTRLPVDNGQVEIDKLTNAFNNMLERIEMSFEKEQYIKEKMRQFISDASHELRTPLTSIHGFVEVLLRGAAKNENQLNLALNSILVESERLTKLVNDLLMLTKLEQQAPVEMLTEDLNSIIKEVYPQLQIIAGERKIKLELKESTLILANRNQVKQVIFNLVQNAIQHTDEKDGVITILLDCIDKSSGNFAVLKIKDNGSGIPQKDLNEIFDRFFRSESHRSRKYGGYGLGLSIVKSIIDAHNGEIEVSSELGRGTTFTVYLQLIS
ncbi:two-component sensor histidine kinase [Clostridium polyendosporum]|uniref:histidine kinase n=1 Tax=Clostridium polyendosporum TaxID=69208 RepID=A0A919VHC3_9CLOT|nr:HAMP domain-containing sensor histidine kinase [Clostridium polyendosporum]GIM29536.1 two-component sensor histidine kinase [Clostridium polyendosporum]